MFYCIAKSVKSRTTSIVFNNLVYLPEQSSAFSMSYELFAKTTEKKIYFIIQMLRKKKKTLLSCDFSVGSQSKYEEPG